MPKITCKMLSTMWHIVTMYFMKISFLPEKRMTCILHREDINPRKIWFISKNYSYSFLNISISISPI